MSKEFFLFTFEKLQEKEKQQSKVVGMGTDIPIVKKYANTAINTPGSFGTAIECE